MRCVVGLLFICGASAASAAGGSDEDCEKRALAAYPDLQHALATPDRPALIAHGDFDGDSKTDIAVAVGDLPPPRRTDVESRR